MSGGDGFERFFFTEEEEKELGAQPSWRGSKNRLISQNAKKGEKDNAVVGRELQQS